MSAQPKTGSALDVARRALAVAESHGATLASHRARMQQFEDERRALLCQIEELREAVAAALEVVAATSAEVVRLRKALRLATATMETAGEDIAAVRAAVAANGTAR
jgi:chromosome segregation ATPase